MFQFTPVEKFLVLILITAILTAGGKNLMESQASPPTSSQNIFEITAPNSTRPTITVYLTGAVKNPGVYTIKEGSRIIDLIERAGGGLADANWEAVNLAEIVHDGDKVHLPSKREPAAAANLPVAPQAKTSDHSNQGKKQTSAERERVNINTATLQELMTLPGIGQKTAEKIIRYREENGPFKSPDDLKKVKGIGEKTFRRLAELITL